MEIQNLDMLANIAEIIGVIIVIGGLYFATLQMRHIRQQRREMAAIELFRFFGSPKFAEAYNATLHIPDNLSAEDIRDGENGLEKSAMLISTTMENIGVMTYQRIVPFVVVNNLIGTSGIVLWHKLENWVRALREDLGEDTAFEWFQWLAERLEENQSGQPQPAYKAHKGWQPSRVTQQF